MKEGLKVQKETYPPDAGNDLSTNIPSIPSQRRPKGIGGGCNANNRRRFLSAPKGMPTALGLGTGVVCGGEC